MRWRGLQLLARGACTHAHARARVRARANPPSSISAHHATHTLHNRSAPALRRIFIGHNTSALNRSPAQSSAMGFIGSSERAKHASSNKGSVWAAVSEAAARRSGGHAQLCVLCRNPSAESEFEQGTLQRLLQGG
jgi:hypothetical protein